MYCYSKKNDDIFFLWKWERVAQDNSSNSVTFDSSLLFVNKNLFSRYETSEFVFDFKTTAIRSVHAIYYTLSRNCWTAPPVLLINNPKLNIDWPSIFVFAKLHWYSLSCKMRRMVLGCTQQRIIHSGKFREICFLFFFKFHTFLIFKYIPLVFWRPRFWFLLNNNVLNDVG